MIKQITNEQIKAILDELLKLNIPVQSFTGIQKLLVELPTNEQNNAKPEVPTE